MNHALPAVILGPLGAAVACSIIALRWKRGIRLGAAIGSLAQLTAVAAIALDVARSGGTTYAVGGWAAPVGILLVADALTVLFLVIITVGHIGFLVHTFSEEKPERKGIWILTEILIAALSGIAVAGDLFNLFVFVELASIATVGLIAQKQSGRAAGAGFVYLVFASISGSLFLVGVVLIYANTGVLTMAQIGARITDMPRAAYYPTVGIMTASLGIKFGLVPFHLWQAPVYHAAGSSIAALLSGTAMKLYLYAFIRVLYHVLQVPRYFPAALGLVLGLGMVNILVGHLQALGERDLKRMLASSSVAHVGYILVGLGAAGSGPAAVAGAAAGLLHALYHAVMKSALFYSGRRMISSAGTSTVNGLDGVARVEPVAFASFFLASLAIVGVPPTSGFLSKWRVAGAAYAEAGLLPLLVVAVGTMISLLYYARVYHLATRASPARVPPAGSGWWRQAITPSAPLLVVALLGLATLVLGFFAPLTDRLVIPAAESIVHAERYLELVQGEP